MYKIIKSKGTHQNIIIENIDTRANVNIGRITSKIMGILEKDGFTFNSTEEPTNTNLIMSEEWSLPLSDDIAKELCMTTFSMNKPKRKIVEKNINIDNKHIDAMDVLLGLAEYKK